jgi:hypothetical protein
LVSPWKPKLIARGLVVLSRFLFDKTLSKLYLKKKMPHPKRKGRNNEKGHMSNSKESTQKCKPTNGGCKTKQQRLAKGGAKRQPKI